MNFSQPKDYLERFRSLRPPHESVKKAVAREIREQCEIRVAPDNIEVRYDVVALRNIHPAEKNKIILSKKTICESVARKIPGTLLKDIH